MGPEDNRFKIIGGVLAQGGGEIRVLGTTPRKAGPHVGYLTQPFSLYLDLSIDENLSYAGGLRVVPPEGLRRTPRALFQTI